MKKIKAIVIGLGNIGYNFEISGHKKRNIGSHFKSYIVNKNYKIVAVCDKNKNILNDIKKKYSDLNTYTDLKQLILKEKFDVASVCVNTENHLKIIKQLIKTDVKNIICEKPAGNNYKELLKVKKEIKKKKILFLVNYSRRYMNSFIKLKKLIIQNNLGKLESFNCSCSGGLYNMGSHMIDMVSWLFDKKITDVKKIKLEKDNFTKDYRAKAILYFDKNTLGFFNILKNKFNLIFETHFYFENGKVEILKNGRSLKILKFRKNKIESTKNQNYNELFIKNKINEIFFNISPTQLLINNLSDFILKKKKFDFCTIDNAINIQKITQKIISK